MQKVGDYTLQVVVKNETAEEIDKYARIVGVSRSRMMREMLEISCDGLRPYYKLGILKKMMDVKNKPSIIETPQMELT